MIIMKYNERIIYNNNNNVSNLIDIDGIIIIKKKKKKKKKSHMACDQTKSMNPAGEELDIIDL